VVKDIRRFAYSLTGSVPDADDLLQMTVTRLLEKGVPDDADVRKWSFRVCKNIWIDGLRAKRTQRNWIAQSDQSEPFEDGARAAAARIELGQVHRAMDRLPEDQRIVLSLVAVEGLSYREAADILEIPIGTVMSRLARARANIVDQLQSAEADPNKVRL